MAIPLSGGNEIVHKVRGARVIWANYSAIRAVLAGMYGGVGNLRAGDIEQWILDEFAVISEPHLTTNTLHDPARSTGETVQARRPATFERTLVRKVRGIEFDIKGAGLRPDRHPKLAPYATGLHYGHNALAEIYNQRLINALLSKHTRIRTVPYLAAILLPISCQYNDIRQFPVPMASLVRPHALRHKYGGDFLPFGCVESELCFIAELTLRSYGITSCASVGNLRVDDTGGSILATIRNQKLNSANSQQAYGITKKLGLSCPAEFDIINIQLAHLETFSSPGHIIDFEQFSYEREFSKPLIQVTTMPSGMVFDTLAASQPDFIRTPKYKISRAKKLQEFRTLLPEVMHPDDPPLVGNEINLSFLQLLLQATPWKTKRSILKRLL